MRGGVPSERKKSGPPGAPDDPLILRMMLRRDRPLERDYRTVRSNVITESSAVAGQVI